jgi:hypothetical protein
MGKHISQCWSMDVHEKQKAATQYRVATAQLLLYRIGLTSTYVFL